MRDQFHYSVIIDTIDYRAFVTSSYTQSTGDNEDLTRVTGLESMGNSRFSERWKCLRFSRSSLIIALNATPSSSGDSCSALNITA